MQLNFFLYEQLGELFWVGRQNNKNNNNNNNNTETRKYWVDIQRGIVSSHEERDPL